MYNVREKLRAGAPLNAKEQVIHELGLVSVLRQIHDDLDGCAVRARDRMGRPCCKMRMPPGECVARNPRSVCSCAPRMRERS
jgi:hypothetical protein